MNEISNNNFIVDSIWNINDLIRGAIRRDDYKDVILPFTFLRRIDCLLKPTKQEVLNMYDLLHNEQVLNRDLMLIKVSGYIFYNTSPFDLVRLLEDNIHIADNLQNYIDGFSQNLRMVFDNFGFSSTIFRLQQVNLLYPITEMFQRVDLLSSTVSPVDMSYIFDALIHKYEDLNSYPGENSSPSDVISLMTTLLLARDEQVLQKPYVKLEVYDPCCGVGGMLFDIRDSILAINTKSRVSINGQDVNSPAVAICKSKLYLKGADELEADNIRHGDTLSQDLFVGKNFDYILSSPPFGMQWKLQKQEVESEHSLDFAGRFGAGLPRVSDSQLLFLQHMIAHMKGHRDGGSRLAVLVSSSALFAGDAGSGESEIRRWIIENDWLETIISLPEHLFFNSGIPTYLLMITNRKMNNQKGKVQLINATSFGVAIQKSIGDKQRIISYENIKRITNLYLELKESKYSELLTNEDFGYRKIIIERPLRLNFQVSGERLAHLQKKKIVLALAKDRKNKIQSPPSEIADEETYTSAVLDLLHKFPNDLYKDRAIFNQLLQERAKATKLILGPALTTVILDVLGQRDETAEICFNKEGKPEPDPELRETENIPLGQDYWTYFVQQVSSHVPDAWVNPEVRDHKDGEVGIVGYEVKYNIYNSLVADYELQELTRNLSIEPSTIAEKFLIPSRVLCKDVE